MSEDEKGFVVSVPLRGKGSQKLISLSSYVENMRITVSVPLRGKGSQKPYTFGNLTKYRFQDPIAHAYGKSRVNQNASILFSRFRTPKSAITVILKRKPQDVNPKNQYFLKITKHC